MDGIKKKCRPTSSSTVQVVLCSTQASMVINLKFMYFFLGQGFDRADCSDLSAKMGGDVTSYTFRFKFLT